MKRVILRIAVCAALLLAFAGVDRSYAAEDGIAQIPDTSVVVAKKNPCNPCGGGNPCNPCGGKKMMNPCGGGNPCNPCGGKKMMNPCGGGNPCSPCNPCGEKIKVTPIRSEHITDYKKLVSMGQKLWNDESLGSAGVSCMTCHADYELLNPGKGLFWPRHVKMTSDIVTLDQMINFCMVNPMEGKPFPPNSIEMTAMSAFYMKYMKGAKGKAVNPCAKKRSKRNPCNPCGGKMMNPCAGKSMNPCNPCGR